MEKGTPMEELLAVDAGLRTGLALYGREGRLLWYGSKHLGNRTSLRRAVRTFLADRPLLRWLVVEGGGGPGELWIREADRIGIGTMLISAEEWRDVLLYQRERRTGAGAKRSALSMALRVIAWSRLPLPNRLGDDAAEAVLAGLWAVLQVGWIPSVPGEIRHIRPR